MSTYDDVAEWYDAWLGPGSLSGDPFWPAAEALLGELAGRNVCDLACGQGRVARHMADLGAHVVAVDLSAKLLEIAQRHEQAQPRGIDYVHTDARTPRGHTWQIVRRRRLLNGPHGHRGPGAHPAQCRARPAASRMVRVFHPPSVLQHAALGRNGDSAVGAYHGTLSTYVNALTDAGLNFERVTEPHATETVAARRPVWVEIPAVLVGRCTKTAGYATLANPGERQDVREV